MHLSEARAAYFLCNDRPVKPEFAAITRGHNPHPYAHQARGRLPGPIPGSKKNLTTIGHISPDATDAAPHTQLPTACAIV